MSRATAEWLNITEPKNTTAISFEDINNFRAGPYANATVDTKVKWCHVMMHVLPSVCSRYAKPDIQVGMAASKATSTSDEALVMWLLRFNAREWETENESAESADASQHDASAVNPPTTTRKRKRKGPHMSQTNLQEFLDMLNATTTKRGTNEGGTEWDDALMTAARDARESGNGSKGSSFDDEIVGTGKASEITAIIMPYDNPSTTPIPVTEV